MSKYTAEQVERIAEFHEQVRLENVERRDKLADKSADMLHDYAALLRERESAKAAVTDEMARKANYIYASYVGGGIESMRAALEAVAPMLVSAQTHGMVCEQHPWSEWPHDDCAGPGMPGTAQYEALVYLAKLASARVLDGWQLVPVEPTIEMLMAGRKQTFADMTGAHMGPSAENTYKAMLAAAPKPETEE